MKPLAKLRFTDLEIGSGDLVFSRIGGLKNKKIDMDVYLPTKQMNLQRDHVWGHLQKSELIMSILMQRPIPPMCILSVIDPVDPSGSDVLQIIDGKQRLSAMKDFYDNKFPIHLENGYYLFKALPEDYKRAIQKYNIKCHMAYDNHDKPISDQVKINWFKMINFSGTQQDKNHLKALEKIKSINSK